MESNERDRKLDQWLDEALKQYGAAEPRFGLEQRVLTNIRASEQERPRARWWRWMPAFAAIAAVIVIGVAVRPLWQGKEQVIAPRQMAPPEAVQTETASTSASMQKSEVQESAGTAVARVEVPKLREKKAAESKPSEAVLSAEVSRTDRVNVEPAAPPAANSIQGGATGGVIGGVIASVPPAPAKIGMPETAAKDNGSIRQFGYAAKITKSEESVAVAEALPAPTGRLKKSNQEMRPAAAQAQEAKTDDSVITLGGMDMPVVRTSLVHVRPGPTETFPTPTPLTREERLLLAAGKELKPTNENASGPISTIVIQDIQIAPLAGPEK